MQRVKDVDRFLADLERPIPTAPGSPKIVTEAELERDAESFLAFAGAMGIKPPGPRSNGDRDDVVTSAPAS